MILEIKGVVNNSKIILGGRDLAKIEDPWENGIPPRSESVLWMVKTQNSKVLVVVLCGNLFRKIDGKKGLGEAVNDIIKYRPLSVKENAIIKESVDKIINAQ